MTLKKRRHDPDEELGPAEEAGPEEREGHPIRSFLLFLLFLAGAILIFGALAARTGGFREIVAVKNDEWFQTKISIGGSRIAFPYDLVLSGIRVPAKTEPGQRMGLLIPEARVTWRPFRGLSVGLDRPELLLVQTAPGTFEPTELEGLGAITNAAGIVEWLQPLNRRASLEIRNGVLAVESLDGAVLRRLEGIRLSVLPVGLPGRPALHFKLACGPLKTPDAGYEAFEQEWLSMEGAPVVEIASGVKGASSAWGRHYWKGDQP